MSSLKANRKPVNLFFIEIMVSLLVFSVSGAVILKVFAAADAKSRKSSMLESVVITAQSIAEVYSQTGDAAVAVADALGVSDVPNAPAEVFMSDGRVRLNFSEERAEKGAGELCVLSMRFFMDEEVIYTLDCSSYVPGGGANG